MKSGWAATFPMRLASRSGAGEIFGIFKSRNRPPGKSQKGNNIKPWTLEDVNRYAKDKAFIVGTWPTAP